MSNKPNVTSKPVQAIKGMKDTLPDATHIWRAVEQVCQSVLDRHNYRELRVPIIEKTQLFARSIGADTDIVSKEMYIFNDRNGDSLTLRPEGTASAVRAGIENGLFYNQQQRLWYCGPMFRHERPQKGRYRQFTQLGAEAYGWATPDIEAEILSLLDRMFSELQLEKTHLEINSLGDSDSRLAFRSALTAYLRDYADQLDIDSQRRLDSNPLRILDSKVASTQAIIANAPSLQTYLSDASKQHFDQLCEHLSTLNISFTHNTQLVRGLDYYNDTVFEWINEDFGAQSAVCAGGRYDSLVSQLGGSQTPAFGFAMGLERLVQMLIEQNAPITRCNTKPDLFIVSMGPEARNQAVAMQQLLCQNGFRVQLHCGEGTMKNQFKRADKSGAKLALIIGEDEVAKAQVSMKVLRGEQCESAQKMIEQKDVMNVVTNCLESL